MRRNNPLKAGLIALPIIYGLTIFVNVFGVTKDGPASKFSDTHTQLNFMISTRCKIIFSRQMNTSQKTIRDIKIVKREFKRTIFMKIKKNRF